MPKRADVAVRAALIDEAAGMLARREPVTLRALATRAGTSTMAVYTHFGGMPGLWSAVRQEGFVHLAERLAGVGPTDDPVHDLAALGGAYADSALARPMLYRAMFDAAADLSDPEVADGSFTPLVEAVARAREAGRVGADDPVEVATRIWVAGHGLLLLVLSGVLPEEAVDRQGPALVEAVCVGAGDDRPRCAASVRAGWASQR
ncbi:TetR/AcrR family transcriptional regulator [Actinomycetospora sp. CA-084318]|uniref:TetR/AcrR family transcriptional regulator n=1 Tax=Actinomycetospora sp. CA-084318 TaxID=3239892 RepID=UPI003D95C27A